VTPPAACRAGATSACACHRASLALPAVKDAIALGRPLIAGFGERIVTAPVGGHGLAVAHRG
jgi:hypothetical protein